MIPGVSIATRHVGSGYNYNNHNHHYMKLVPVRQSVSPFVCPSTRPQQQTAAAGLLLWARPLGDVDRLQHGAQQRGGRMRAVPRRQRT